MALSRSAVLLLMLPAAPASVYLAASLEEVNASSQCLPSAEAVKQQYPGSWASWTFHAAGHKGERCWFPAMRENHARHIEAALRRTGQALAHKEGQHHEEAVPSDKAADADNAQVAVAADANQLGWSFRSRTVTVVPAGVVNEAETAQSSFDDRFAAARGVSSLQKPSIIQRMMDPVGIIPNIP
jgi:hypothetical protein